MSKTFKTPPKPKQLTDDAIEAFESGGLGHDTKPTNEKTHIPTIEGKQANQNIGAVESTKRLSLDLPVSVHRRFKTACSATDTKMVREIMEFIQLRTAELEKQAGIRS